LPNAARSDAHARGATGTRRARLVANPRRPPGRLEDGTCGVLLLADHGHGHAEPLHLVGQVCSQPLGHAVRQRGDQDVVEIPFGQRVLDRLKRVGVADDALNRAMSGALKQRDRALKRPVLAAARPDVRDEQRERCRALVCAALDFLKQQRRASGPIRNDERASSASRRPRPPDGVTR